MDEKRTDLSFEEKIKINEKRTDLSEKEKIKMDKKRTDLSLKEKIEILNKYESFPKMSQRNAAAQLKISQPLLCKILKNREDLLKKAKEDRNTDCKRNRCGKDEKVEKALKIWFKNGREHDAPISGTILRQKAEDLAAKMGQKEFVATDGWFNRWRKRENIIFKQICGEEKSSDVSAGDQWIKKEWLKHIASYAPKDVYNAVETGLYYSAMPSDAYFFKSESTEGYKVSKEHVTILCCVSMTGDKKKLLVVGKSKKPHCFQGIKKLPVDYFANNSACMTSVIFNNWLLKWDNQLNHKILLLIDNCKAHTLNVSLKHINVVFLPANTSLIQPCDQGIIRTLKAYYRHEMRARILESFEDYEEISANDLAKKTTLLEAVHLLTSSWYRIPVEMIRNCFALGGFCEPLNEKLKIVIQPPEGILEEEFEEWMAIDEDIPVAAILTDLEICQAVCEQDETIIADDSDDDECVEDNPPTNAEMRQALDILKRGVQYRSTNFKKQYEYEHFINELLRNNCRQAMTNEFF